VVIQFVLVSLTVLIRGFVFSAHFQSRDVWERLDVLGGFGGIETSPRRGRILDLLPTRVMMSLCIDNYWIELR